MNPRLHSATLLITACILLSLVSLSVRSQISFGAADQFRLFTVTGAVTNTGTSRVEGSIGTHVGAVSGFELPTVVSGTIHIADSLTGAARTDLLAAATYLDNLVPTVTNHLPVFGQGETIVAGVYTIAEAGSLNGILTMDAQGNPNARFVLKFAGAFSGGASCGVVLINGARAANVVWKVTGAITMAAGSMMKGTLMANDGAVSLAAGSVLEGNMYSVAGAITTDQSQVYQAAIVTLPVSITGFFVVPQSAGVQVSWNVSEEINIAEYMVERSSDGINYTAIGSVAAKNNNTEVRYSWMDREKPTGVAWYRLRIISSSMLFTFSRVISIQGGNTHSVTLFPNPSAGNLLRLRVSGHQAGTAKIRIHNPAGHLVSTAQVLLGNGSALTTVSTGRLLRPGVYYLELIDAGSSKSTITFAIN